MRQSNPTQSVTEAFFSDLMMMMTMKLQMLCLAFSSKCGRIINTVTVAVSGIKKRNINKCQKILILPRWMSTDLYYLTINVNRSLLSHNECQQIFTLSQWMSTNLYSLTISQESRNKNLAVACVERFSWSRQGLSLAPFSPNFHQLSKPATLPYNTAVFSQTSSTQLQTAVTVQPVRATINLAFTSTFWCFFSGFLHGVL
jgi:hypothetical protein